MRNHALTLWGICLLLLQGDLLGQCDSTIVTELITEACQSQSIHYNGVEIFAGDTASFHLTTPAGCDSMVIVSVKTIEIDTSYLTLSTCAESPVIFQGTTLAAGANTPFHFTSYQGCDSIVWVEVVAEQIDTTLVELYECYGESAYYQGQYIEAGSSIWLTLTSSNGCDSIIHVYVEAITLDTGSVQLAACRGEAVLYSGYSILAGESQLITLDYSDGCDTSILVSVAIIPADTTYLELSVCKNETIEYQGFTFSSGDETLMVLENRFGCDSNIFVSVNNHPAIAFESHATGTCPEAAEGSIAIDILEGTAPFLCALENNPFESIDVFTGLKSGTYSVRVQDAFGCLEQDEVFVAEREKLSVLVNDYILPCGEPFVTIRPSVLSNAGELKWYWSDGTDQHWMLANDVGTVYFTVADDCKMEEKTVNIIWDDDRPEEPVYIPNAFSPNHDGINDFFKAYFANGANLLSYELHVFDRWGAQMFYTQEPSHGWDGTNQSELMNPGLYAWFVKAKLELCGQVEELFHEGGVTLMR